MPSCPYEGSHRKKKFEEKTCPSLWYSQKKVVFFSGGDHIYIWPSISAWVIILSMAHMPARFICEESTTEIAFHCLLLRKREKEKKMPARFVGKSFFWPLLRWMVPMYFLTIAGGIIFFCLFWKKNLFISHAFFNVVSDWTIFHQSNVRPFSPKVYTGCLPFYLQW